MFLTYLLSEVRRSYRNPRYLLFTIVVPVVLFLLIGGAFDGDVAGVAAGTWYMVNMGVFGALGAVLGIGSRIAVERDAGWNRQLRLTPLPPLAYVLGKVATGLLVALPALVLVGAAGILTGRVDLGVVQAAEMLGLTWLAVAPMAVVGVGIGYLARGDSAQAVNGGVLMLLSMFGGLWFPIEASPAWIRDIAQATPTYWVTVFSRAAITDAWPKALGWLVLAAWAAVGAWIAARRYRVDDLRAG